MGIEVAVLSVMIALILAVISLGYWAGKLTERVGNNRYDIEEHKKESAQARIENREDHLQIIKLIKNGGKDA